MGRDGNPRRRFFDCLRFASFCLLVASTAGLPFPVAAAERGATTRVGGHASGSAAGADVDIVAERAYMRTGSNSGAEVAAPALNQRVFFHVAWRVDGSSPLLQVSFRALLDGEVFCSDVAQVSGGNSITTFCNAGWFATAGTHQLLWELDYTQTIGETSGANNSASRIWGTGAQVNVDVRANRAYMRTGPGSGPEVDTPAPGQSVYFHLNWSETDLPTSVDVPLRATIDGEQVCAGAQAANGTSNAWCTVPWQATPGGHVLRWELDRADVIVEVDEGNNEIERGFFVGVEATATRTATRTRTASPTRSVTPTPLAGTPTATRTRVVIGGDAYYGRGDADCSITHRAADVVATLRGIDGQSACGNDDCDRDGALTDADAACAAGCLFGECGVPANAPRVTGVTPDSAADAVPGSVVTVSGDNLGAGTVKRVVVGGVEAEIVDFDGDRLTIVLPFIEPGPTTLVVYDGEIPSLPMPVTLSPPVPIGEPDTLRGLLDLLDEAATRFASLDLSMLYHEGEIPLILEALADFRAEIAARPEAALSAEEIADLDFRVDASGIPEQLRGLLADLDAFERGEGGGAGATVIIRTWGGTVYRGIRWLGASGGTAGIIVRTAFGPLILKGVVAGVVVVGAVKAGVEISRPGAFDARFFNASGVELVEGLAAAGGSVRVTMSNLFSAFAIDLIMRTIFAEWRLPSTVCGSNCREYRIPNVPGVCGRVSFRLARGPIVGDAELPGKIQPGLIDAGPPSVGFDEPIEIFATGFAPCDTQVTFHGPSEGAPRLRVSGLVDPDPADHNRLSTPPVLDLGGRLRDLPPGVHDVGLRVHGIDSDTTNPVRIRSRVEGLDLSCDETVLTLPEEPLFPNVVTLCEVRPLPEDLEGFPVDTEMTFTSSDTGIVTIPQQPVDPLAAVNLRAAGELGPVTLTAKARSSGIDLGSAEIRLTVEDRTPPEIRIEDDTVPVVGNGCGRARFEPGDSFRFGVEGDDNHSTARIRVRAPAESLEPSDRDFFCPLVDGRLERMCAEIVDFTVREDAPSGPVTLRVQATDGSANESELTCTYFIESDATPVPQTATRTPTPTPTRTPTRTPTHSPAMTPGVFEIEFTKLEDSPRTLPGPDGFERYIEYDIDDGRIAYLVRSTVDPSREGIVLVSDDQRTLIVPTTTEIPEQSSTFRVMGDLSIDGALVGFGTPLFTGRLYTRALTHGAAEVTQRLWLLRPPFSSFTQAILDGGRVGFLMGSVSPSDVRIVGVATSGTVSSRTDDNVIIVADTDTPVPGGTGTFVSVGHDRLQGLAFEAGPEFGLDNLAFVGEAEDGDRGAYISLEGEFPHVAADHNTAIPGSTGTFNEFCGLALDGDSLAFRGQRTGGGEIGVYVYRNGAVRRVADSSTILPRMDDMLSSFTCEVAMDNGVVAFRAFAPGDSAIAVEIGGELVTVAKSDDVLGGMVVDAVLFHDDGALDGSPLTGVAQILFEVIYEDRSGALYLATIR